MELLLHFHSLVPYKNPNHSQQTKLENKKIANEIIYCWKTYFHTYIFQVKQGKVTVSQFYPGCMLKKSIKIVIYFVNLCLQFNILKLVLEALGEIAEKQLQEAPCNRNHTYQYKHVLNKL